jgi:hypothetical protein
MSLVDLRFVIHSFFILNSFKGVVPFKTAVRITDKGLQKIWQVPGTTNLLMKMKSKISESNFRLTGNMRKSESKEAGYTSLYSKKNDINYNPILPFYPKVVPNFHTNPFFLPCPW